MLAKRSRGKDKTLLINMNIIFRCISSSLQHFYLLSAVFIINPLELLELVWI